MTIVIVRLFGLNLISRVHVHDTTVLAFSTPVVLSALARDEITRHSSIILREDLGIVRQFMYLVNLMIAKGYLLLSNQICWAVGFSTRKSCSMSERIT